MYVRTWLSRLQVVVWIAYARLVGRRWFVEWNGQEWFVIEGSSSDGLAISTAGDGVAWRDGECE